MFKFGQVCWIFLFYFKTDGRSLYEKYKKYYIAIIIIGSWALIIVAFKIILYFNRKNGTVVYWKYIIKEKIYKFVNKKEQKRKDQEKSLQRELKEQSPSSPLSEYEQFPGYYIHQLKDLSNNSIPPNQTENLPKDSQPPNQIETLPKDSQPLNQIETLPNDILPPNLIETLPEDSLPPPNQTEKITEDSSPQDGPSSSS
ncbi:hypothetical protein ACTFIW_007103 [Dictyostelium discoideum]